MNVTLCWATLWFVHVIRSPTWMVSVFGLKANEYDAVSTIPALRPAARTGPAKRPTTTTPRTAADAIPATAALTRRR